MDSVEVNQNEELLDQSEDLTVETCADHLVSLGSPGTDGIFGEPQAFPRLGDQYQVEIPSLITESERLQLRHVAFNSDQLFESDYFIGVRLPIPVMWVRQVGNHIKLEQQFCSTTVYGHKIGSVESVNHKGSWVDPGCNNVCGYLYESSGNYRTLTQGLTCKVKFGNDVLEHDEEFAGSKSPKCANLDDHTKMGLPCLLQNETTSSSALPGSPVTCWSDTESQSFLLGLYIFGKNLVHIEKFIDSKKMGDILSFYYGKFYRSDAYHRWSECRKIRSRRCIYGQRIFTGWRQQELLSRVLPSMSKEVQDTLLEATRNFSEGRASLEEYVFTLKTLIGMKKLVEAIGIGEGKYDLTGIVLNPFRTNHVIPIRPEIPVGKAFASLTSGDIIKFLTGDFRLSKAKSHDLFWEAVWPRLLAKGWHSEQPLDLVSTGSKSALVFLVPGIKKFSRRRLVKGNHYFDSVSDVLSKVASDPRLLELEIEAAKDNNSTKEALDVNMILDQNDPSDYQRHNYLCPKLSNFSSELMKFTVVDTSLFHGETPYKVRELRSLPVDATYCYAPSSPSGRADSDSLEQDSNDIGSNDQGEPDPGISISNKLREGVDSNLSNHLVNVTKKRILEDGYNSNDRPHDLLNDKQPIYEMKSQANHRVKSDHPNSLTPVSKRQRLAACKKAGSSRRTLTFLRGHRLKKKEPHCEWRSFKASENKDAEADPSGGMRYTSSFAKRSPHESTTYFSISALSETAMSQDKEKPQPRIFDLNIPQFSPDTDTNEPVFTEVATSQGNLNLNESSLTTGIKQQLDNFQAFESPDCSPSMQEPTTNAVRQSTRSRPLTTKALEAFACGFLSTERRGRITKAHPLNNLTSRSSRQAHRAAKAPMLPPVKAGIMIPNTVIPNVGIEYSSYMNHTNNARMQGAYSSYTNYTNHASMYNESPVQSESEETHELLGVP